MVGPARGAVRPLPEAMIIVGDCRTMGDPPRAEAVRIEGEQIVDVGEANDLRARAPGTRVLRVEGVTPGVHDAHAHPLAWGVALGEVDMYGVVDPREVAERILARVASTPPGTWVCGRGYLFDHYPDSTALDAAAPNHPVLVTCRDMHSAWANRLAMQQAGIGKDQPDPENGCFVRDAEGRPTGYLLESAVRLVEDAMPPPGPRELIRGLDDLARRGYVAVHSLGWAADQTALAWAQELAADGRLPVRLWWALAHAAWDGVTPGWRGPDLEVAGAKFFADGSLGSRTAWMHELYSDGSSGMPLQDRAEIRTQGERALAQGFTMAVHAIGTRAVAEVVGIFRELAPRARRPFRLEHAQHIRTDDLPTLSGLPLAVSMQPNHLPGDAPFIRRFLNGREHEAFRFQDLWRLGVPMALGSDAPVLVPDLDATLAAATGHALDPEQSLAREQAVWAFTRGAAIAAGWDDYGVLKPAARADLALWENGRLIGRVFRGNVDPVDPAPPAAPK